MAADLKEREPPRAANDAGTEAAPASADVADLPQQQQGWSTLWQAPTIIISVALIAGGLMFASRHKPAHDFDGAFDQVEQLIASSQFEPAAAILEENIEPHLPEATEAQRGRFHALAGDALYKKMEYDGLFKPDLSLEVARRYQSAEENGCDLTPAQIERWGNALLDVGDITAARARLTSLEVLAIAEETGEQARTARSRLMRRIVERSLTKQNLPFQDAMAVLGEYRSAPNISIENEIWAVARQSELRLENGNVRDAVDRLQIDMRRLESRLEGSSEHFGELYTLLGRGYYEIGDLDFAQELVNRAIELLDRVDPRTADAWVVQGRIMLAQSRFDEAFDAFSIAVIDYEGTRGWLAGVLGRAEVQGILGNHEASQNDFNMLADELPLAGPRRDVTPARAVKALIDRHDAALATTQIDIALEYMLLAERFIDPARLPAAALYRLASGHRLLAERLLSGEGSSEAASSPAVDPSTRREASRLFKKSGDYFVLHADAVGSDPIADRSWLESQFAAADAYDLAGYFDLAIRHFGIFVEGRSAEDTQRLAAAFRLARCHQAILEYDKAAALFEEVIAANPTSSLAQQSHVPLAACYESMGSPSQAEQQLLRVVLGGEPVQPEATDYRDALFALGTLYYNQGDDVRAIEEIDKALQYYPDDPRANELRFRLADAYRKNAQAIAAVLAEATLARSIEQEKETLRRRHLNEASMLFTRVVDEYERRGPRTLDALQSDYLRYAYLYRADCAFALGEYGRAIGLYDQAARTYAEHPSSLIALIQIVNAYNAMGDDSRALTAHNRVLLRLEQLPEGAIESGDGILDEDAWRRWLEGLPPGFEVSGMAAGEND